MMYFVKWCLYSSLLLVTKVYGANDYNVLNRDGSYEFGYDNPNSFQHTQANRNNVVRGEFGSRNPGTGAIDTIQYTAGPRGFRPRGRNVARKYDLGQVRTGPIGSRDDPYFDPNEDPSYNFAFQTRTHSRQEAANRVGDVSGKYTFIDDVGERHNVEYIAGKNTGFHVKSPIPDNKPLPFGPLQYVGKRRPVPRGRTTIQRGLDGSYRFVSGGPDHRRTETSDSKGHVRGSYTYLDDKGVRHSVHYIAGPETGYRVLKNVKGPHLPTIFPFGRPEIIPPDFYDFPNADEVFNTAASGHIKPPKGGAKPTKPSQGEDEFNFDNGSNISGGSNFDDGFGKPTGPGGTTGFGPGVTGSGPGGDFGSSGTDLFGLKPTKRPPFGFGGSRPGGGKPTRPSYYDEDDGSDLGDLFGGSSKPGTTTNRPGGVSDSYPDDGSYKPTGSDGSYRPDTSGKPGGFGPSGGSAVDGFPSTGKPGTSKPGRPNYDETGSNDLDDFNLFGSTGGGGNVRPTGSGGGVVTGEGGSGGGGSGSGGSSIGVTVGSTGNRPGDVGGTGHGEYDDRGTLVTNLGDKLFSVPPGVSVRAHVQAIDLLPLGPRSPSPSQQVNAEESGELKTESTNIDEELSVDATDNNSTIALPPSNTTESFPL